MSSEQILSNARIVTAEREFLGSLLLRDGLIAAVDEGASHLPQAQDLGGDYLLPGLVELHTDNLERHIQPRPRVDWPHGAAIIAHDAELASVGITTVFDALRAEGARELAADASAKVALVGDFNVAPQDDDV